MCRILAYLGEPLSVQSLLFDTDNSLVQQSYSPRMMNTFLNLAGFGMKAWDPTSLRPEDPFTYRATTLPSFDRNLRHIASKLASTCLVAHVRGVTYSGEAVVAETNLHPFHFAGARVVLAHNGHLRQFSRMRYSLLEHVRPELARANRGDDRLRVDLRARPLAARRSLRGPGDPRARRRHRQCAPHPAHGPRRAWHRHLLAGQPLRQHRPRRGRHPRLVRLRLVPGGRRDARDRPPVREPLVRDRRRVHRARRRLADDGRRSAALGDHRLRAAHDQLLDLVRGAGVLDADRRARRRKGSSSRRGTWMSDRETVDFLATVPLLEGRDEADLAGAGAGGAPADGARQARCSGARASEARELVFIVDGSVSASLHLPGDRTVEIWRGGPGETVGEIALLDGKGHTMSVRVTETATMLALGRVEFAALLARHDPSAFQAEAPPRLGVHLTPSQSARASRSLARRARWPAREPRMRPGRSPSWSSAVRPTANTCVAWRRSTTSIRWRCGAS